MNLINTKEITSNTVEEVKNEIINLLNQKGYTAGSDEDREQFFGGEKFSSNSIQKLQIDGKMNGDWQTTITVVIYENYIDAGSDDYFYTAEVRED